MEIEYEPGELGHLALVDALDACWQSIQVDPAARDALEVAGCLGRRLETVFVLRPASSAIDAGTASIIVASLEPASRALASLWDEIVLPRLRRRFGDDAMGQERRREP